MSAVRFNPNLVKMRRAYTTRELATMFGVHKNTVRGWQRGGLAPLDSKRPILFMGGDVRAFLARRNADRKRPCPPGTLYCLRCRAPRQPALGMIDYIAMTPTSGNLRAICETCQTVMHRRVRMSSIATVLPGLAVHMAEGPARLTGRPHSSLNCGLEGQATP